MEDIDNEGVDPISRFPEYIPLCKGKVKVSKDRDVGQFLLNTPLLLENMTFEGPYLAGIPHLKLEDWDLMAHKQFPHLATETFMQRVSYKESGVTVLEPMEWIHGVNMS